MTDDTLDALIDSYYELATISEEGVTAALDGFPLQCRHGYRWLTRALQVALLNSMPVREDDPYRRDPASNEEVRGEIDALAALLMQASLAISTRSPAADEAILEGMREESAEINPGAVIHDTQAALDMLALSLLRAAKRVPTGKHKREDGLKSDIRVARAYCLSTIYKLAYDREPTVNTRPLAKDYGPWPDFYCRIIKMVFGLEETRNLLTVLNKARRRHLDAPITYDADLPSITALVK